VNFRGERRSNDTHASTTDPDARLAKIKGKEAKLSYRGHILVENRNGLIADCELTQATGTAEPEAAATMLGRERTRRGKGKMTVGADRGYNTRGFVGAARAVKVTPHVAKKQRHNAIDGRTTRHQGYEISQRRRKVVEEPFGWMKNVGGLRKLLHRGTRKVSAVFTLACAAFNLVRMSTLMAKPALETGNGAR
jgi:IS5 family transposase